MRLRIAGLTTPLHRFSGARVGVGAAAEMKELLGCEW